MSRQAIYLANSHAPDAAITNGLTRAGYIVRQAHSVAEALQVLSEARNGHFVPTILVAEVQAGAIPLLTLLRDHHSRAPSPTTLVFDRDGSDIRAAVSAFQLGAQDYVLEHDPDVVRECAAQLLAERCTAQGDSDENGRPMSSGLNQAHFDWDPIAHVIQADTHYVRLSRTEGHIFAALCAQQGHTVALRALVKLVFPKPDMDAETGAQRLRPHMVRLRRKLAAAPALANRIVSVRGVGYMLAWSGA